MINDSFKIDPIVSFFSLWSEGLNQLSNPTTEKKISFKNLLDSFLSKNISLLYDSFSFLTHATIDDKKKIVGQLKELTESVNSGKYQNIHSLFGAIQGRFNLGEKEMGILQGAYQSYEHFFNLNKREMLQNRCAIISKYQREGVFSYFEDIHDVFGLDKEKNPSNYLHHYPADLLVTGYATPTSIHQNISLTKDEDKKNYLGDSGVLSRRIYTPIHEMGHFLFENSAAAKDILSKEDSSAHQLFQILKNYYQPQKKEMAGNFAFAAIHEAFAESVSSCFRKEDPNLKRAKGERINCNFGDVDDIDILICSFYPTFKKYVDAKKPLDDNFFKDVLNSPDFKKKFINPLQIREMLDKNVSIGK